MRHPVMGLLALGGCLGPWDPAWDPPSDTDRSARETGTSAETATSGATGHTGAPPDLVLVDAPITSSTTWTADHVYVLRQSTIVYVEGDAVLKIDPGTTVVGEPESALVITRDARIDARGRADAPIVFTSASPAGQRRPGDWGGLVLLGDAVVNKPLPRQIEGVLDDEPRAQYGGSDDSSNCGALDFVRIEFAGFEVFEGNELNALTLGGCGTSTFIRHVQVHRGLDDGIEIFGGTVDLKWVVITGAGDDSLDWDEGWRGRAQFVLAQQYPVHPDPSVSKNGDEGIEADGYLTDEEPAGAPDGVLDTQHAPFSTPTLVNVSLFGSHDPASAQGAMHFKEGTGGLVQNALVAWQSTRGVDVEHGPTADLALAGTLRVTNSLFFDLGATGDGWADADAIDDDLGLDEVAWLAYGPYANRLSTAVMPAPDRPPGGGQDPAWLLDPPARWIPSATSEAARGAAIPPADEFFDPSATYVGAVRPDTSQGLAWWAGWTAFPSD